MSKNTHFVFKSRKLTDIPNTQDVDKQGIVFADFTNNNLTNITPICVFTNLTMLRCNKNKLSSISPEIGCLTQLKILDFSSNFITSIPISLSLLTNLQELSFTQNNLTNIPIELSSLVNLQRVYLTANYIKKMSHQLTTFTNLRVKLEISNNELPKIPKCVCSYTSLTALRFDFNYIKHITSSLSQLKNLACITLNNNRFEAFPSAIHQIPSLTCLELSNNKIPAVSSKISNLTNLKNFFIDSNNLVMVPIQITCLTALNTFSMAGHLCRELPNMANLTKLTYVNLGNGRLTKLEKFPGNNCLLRLYQNLIEEISFEEKSTFELIDLSNNRLKECPSFSQQEKIYKVDISRNRIDHFTLSSINNSLISLDNTDNPITDSPTPLFLCTNLVILNVSCCHLNKIPIEISKLVCLEQFLAINNTLTNVCDEVKYLSKLSLLSLQSNNLINFPTQCVSLLSLKSLSLANNELTTIPQNITTLSNLQSIDLSCNKISEMGALLSLSNIEAINMSYNQLFSISSKLSEIKNLESLNIIGNEIEKIPQWIFNLKIQRLQLGKQGKKKAVMEMLTGVRSSSPFIIAPFIESEKQVQQFNLPDKCSYFQTVGTTSNLTMGLSEMQGRRVDMQDNCCIIKDFCGNGHHLICLFDGHGGMETSRLCAASFPSIISQKLKDDIDKSLREIMEESFVQVNEECKRREYMDGSAALVVLITPFKYCVSNCGDSRGLLIRFNSMEVLTHDHKPSYFDEYERLRKHRGFVDQNGRINGTVAVSRSIGDIDCQPALSCLPETELFDRKEGDGFIVVACDGVWDVVSNEEVCDLVRAHSEDQPEKIACLIRDIAYARNSGDNISCVVCKLIN